MTARYLLSILSIATAVLFSGSFSFAFENGGCESSADFRIDYEQNSNVFMTTSGPVSDGAYRYSFGLDHDCALRSGDTLKFDLGRDEMDFFNEKEENYTYTELGAEYTHQWRNETWFRFSLQRDITETSDTAFVEMEGDTDEYEFRMGTTFGPKTSGEMYFGREKSRYEIYETSDADEDIFGIEYTYDLGGFSYIEVSYEKTDKDYMNSYLYDTETFLESSQFRTDEKSTFSVTVAKTISLYPLKYLYVTAESSENESTSNMFYDWFDPDTFEYNYFFRAGYDDYSNFNWSVYYIHDLSDKASLSLYYLNDHTDYGNFLITYDDFYTRPSVPVTVEMDLFYAAVSYRLRGDTMLELSGTRTDNNSNYSYMSYEQDLYNLSVSYDF